MRTTGNTKKNKTVLTQEKTAETIAPGEKQKQEQGKKTRMYPISAETNKGKRTHTHDD